MRTLIVAIVALALMAPGTASAAGCTQNNALAIADTLYLDWTNWTPGQGTPDAGEVFHIYVESNNVRLLQRSELPSLIGEFDTLALGCGVGDTLVL